MGAEIVVEWTRDLGEGRSFMMARGANRYRGFLMNGSPAPGKAASRPLGSCRGIPAFHGTGSTTADAVDDFIARLQDYAAFSDAYWQSIDAKLRRLERLVDQIVQGRA